MARGMGDAGLSYGQEWARGDIIGCMIDLDLGTISFARNGQSLGQAFASIRRLEYYPAASLSYGAASPCNFPQLMRQLRIVMLRSGVQT